MEENEKYGLTAFLLNFPLLALKASAAMMSGSLTVLSSAFDSLNDILSYFFSYYAVKEAEKGPDLDHPFGHRRVAPAAGIVMAILAALLAFEILKSAVLSLITNDHQLTITSYTFGVLIITIAVKAGMFVFLKKRAKENSAIDAMMTDSRNDVLFNSVAIVGVAGTWMGYLFFDDLVAIVIALYIGYTGYSMARKNYNYMTGARPDQAVVNAICAKAAAVPGVKRIDTMRAHYVGDRVHVEVEVVLDRKVGGPESHDIAMSVQNEVESVDIVERAFVHLNYE